MAINSRLSLNKKILWNGLSIVISVLLLFSVFTLTVCAKEYPIKSGSPEWKNIESVMNFLYERGNTKEAINVGKMLSEGNIIGWGETHSAFKNKKIYINKNLLNPKDSAILPVKQRKEWQDKHPDASIEEANKAGVITDEQAFYFIVKLAVEIFHEKVHKEQPPGYIFDSNVFFGLCLWDENSAEVDAWTRTFSAMWSWALQISNDPNIAQENKIMQMLVILNELRLDIGEFRNNKYYKNNSKVVEVIADYDRKVTKEIAYLENLKKQKEESKKKLAEIEEVLNRHKEGKPQERDIIKKLEREIEEEKKHYEELNKKLMFLIKPMELPLPLSAELEQAKKASNSFPALKMALDQMSIIKYLTGTHKINVHLSLDYTEYYATVMPVKIATKDGKITSISEGSFPDSTMDLYISETKIIDILKAKPIIDVTYYELVPHVDTYNKNIEQVPGIVKMLFGKERINAYIKNGKEEIIGIIMQDAKIIEFGEGEIKNPTIKMYTDKGTIHRLMKDPSFALEALDKGQIKCEGIGITKQVKVFAIIMIIKIYTWFSGLLK